MGFEPAEALPSGEAVARPGGAESDVLGHIRVEQVVVVRGDEIAQAAGVERPGFVVQAEELVAADRYAGLVASQVELGAVFRPGGGIVNGVIHDLAAGTLVQDAADGSVDDGVSPRFHVAGVIVDVDTHAKSFPGGLAAVHVAGDIYDDIVQQMHVVNGRRRQAGFTEYPHPAAIGLGETGQGDEVLLQDRIRPENIHAIVSNFLEVVVS